MITDPRRNHQRFEIVLALVLTKLLFVFQRCGGVYMAGTFISLHPVLKDLVGLYIPRLFENEVRDNFSFFPTNTAHIHRLLMLISISIDITTRKIACLLTRLGFQVS